MNKVQLKAMQEKCAAYNKIVKVLGKNHKIKLDSEFDADTSIDAERLKLIRSIVEELESKIKKVFDLISQSYIMPVIKTQRGYEFNTTRQR